MMVLDALIAEQRKLFSTGGWLIGLVCLVAFGMVMPVGNAITANSSSAVVSNTAGLAGVADFGLLVLMVLAVVTVTREYQFGTAKTSFLGLPQRWQWLTAKALLMATLGALSSAVMAALGVLAVGAIAVPAKQNGVSVVAALPQVGMAALVTAIILVLVVGVAALVRSTPTAVALVILWPTVVELLLAKLPGLSEYLPKLLIWSNVGYAMTGNDSGVAFLWGPAGAVGYLASLAAILFAAGIVSTLIRPPQE